MSGARLIVFDLGRVLVRICDGWEHAFALAGVTLPDNVLDAAMRERWLNAVSRIETGESPVPAFCEEVAKDLRLECELVTRMWNGYTLGPFSGADQLLTELRGTGATTACLSNTNAEHWRVLTDPSDAHGRVVNRLDHHFASHLIGIRKPDAAIYEHVERVTGAAPESIIFFDDLEANVAAAHRRRWSAHQIRIDSDPIAQIRVHLRGHGILH